MKFRSYGAQIESNVAPVKAKMSRTNESVSEISSTEFSVRKYCKRAAAGLVPAGHSSSFGLNHGCYELWEFIITGRSKVSAPLPGLKL